MRELVANVRWGNECERQSMLIENGRVVARGPGIASADAKVTDLGGKFVLPSFVDGHCHILPLGLDLQKPNLCHCASQAEVLEAVRDSCAGNDDSVSWLLCVHYDQNRFPDGKHLDRFALDAISPNRPIVLRHSNGHASVVNTAALRAAGIDADTPNPQGGQYDRSPDGELTGVLFETAHEWVTSRAPRPTIDEMTTAILAAGELMASRGINCAHDMMTGVFDLESELKAYRFAAERGCKISTRLYLQWKSVFGPKAVDWRRTEELITGMDAARCKVAGIKIFADGAIGSATAAIYGAYSGEPPSGKVLSANSRPASSTDAGTQVSGQLIYNEKRLKEMVLIADRAGHQVAIHSIGDYSTDLVLDAFSATEDPRRHRIEHAMLLSDAQIARMAALGVFCTFQPEFLVAFGATYARQLGQPRFGALKRARSVLDAGIRLSFSSDAPIVSGNPWIGIRAATNRPEGFDPRENCTFEEAIHAYTQAGADLGGDGGDFGSLNPGQLAQFNVFESITE